MSSFPFEFLLLEHMTPTYREATLRALGMPPDQIAAHRKQCSLLLPDQLDSDVTVYEQLLGPPAKQEPCKDLPSQFAGSVAYLFVLMLWPDLFWVVHRRPDGGSWGVGFRNQHNRPPRSFDPSLVRPGLWTRELLQRVAPTWTLHDGWNEKLAIRFSIDDGLYEGLFVLGLLQEWRRVEL